MLTNFFAKLKIILKRFIGKVVYIYTYLKGYTPILLKKLKNQNSSTFISSLIKEWKISSLIIFGIVILYYGLGALVSSNINNTLNKDIKVNPSTERHATTFLIYALKAQIDDTPWTPSLPLIFPASVLDNLPNFQLGAKNANLYIIKKLSSLYLDQSLKNASILLDYPENIWLFSQDKNDKLSPGSAKQYRKALGELKEFSKTEVSRFHLTPSDFYYQLDAINSILNRQLQKLEKHIQEHSTDFIDTKLDNLFYYTQGTLYTIHYYLSGLTKDYSDLIVEKELYDDITSALKSLNKAITLNPMLVKNSPLEDIYGANHLMYLAYNISKAKNILTTISYTIKELPSKDIRK